MVRMKVAPQVTRLFTLEEPSESNLALVRLWREIQREQEVERRTALRTKPEVEAQPALRRVRFNYD